MGEIVGKRLVMESANATSTCARAAGYVQFGGIFKKLLDVKGSGHRQTLRERNLKYLTTFTSKNSVHSFTYALFLSNLTVRCKKKKLVVHSFNGS